MKENQKSGNRPWTRTTTNVLRTSKKRSRINRILLKIVYIVILFLSFLLVLIMIPGLLLCLSPNYLFRYIVFKSSKRLRPDLGKIMSSRSAILGTDTIYSDPKCVIVSRVILGGILDLEKFQQNIQKLWIEGKTKEGLAEYPELSQCITTWMGYLFWKYDKDFHIKNHVKLYNNKEFQCQSQSQINDIEKAKAKSCDNEYETPESVNAILVKLVSKPFEEGKSPWEIILVQNYCDDCDQDQDQTEYQNQNDDQNSKTKSVLLIRWHHSLMDGTSSYKLLSKITTLKLNLIPSPKSYDAPLTVSDKTSSNIGKILKSFGTTLWYCLRAPHEALRAPLESLDINPWHLPESKLSRNSYIFHTEGIPLKKIYELKSNYEVTFSAIVYTLIAGAMRNFMKKSRPGDKIPKLIHAGLSFPFPGHPDKLRNHMAICTSKLPVGIEDPVRRLHFMDKHLNQLKESTVPSMSFYLVPFLGTLPRIILKALVRNNNTTIMLSNMPGPKERIKFVLEQQLVEWEDWVYASGHGPGSVGISIFALTYNGLLKFCVVVDSALVINKSMAQELSDGITQEMTVLDKLFNNEV